jgi:hypothetical protein
MEVGMKKLFLVLSLVACAAALAAQTATGKILYVYDEVNKQSTPYIGYFRAALAQDGIAFDEATASQAAKMDLSGYRAVLIHGMVMAFNSRSLVRDWLKAEGRLGGTRVALLVTANRWFLDKLKLQLTELLRKDGALPVDVVSAATKTMDEAAKEAVVRSLVAELE